MVFDEQRAYLASEDKYETEGGGLEKRQNEGNEEAFFMLLSGGGTVILDGLEWV